MLRSIGILRALVFLLVFTLTLAFHLAQACTRAVYLVDNGDVITARSMDWSYDIETNLWIFPRGMHRSGQTGPNSLQWTSKYGSVIASGYEISTTDGMNEKGLVVNVLWLVESQYPKFDGSKPGLAISIWAQYVLDNFATVKEAVDTPNTFWVNFKDVDFSAETGKVLKLDLGKDQRNVFSGNAVKDFKPSEPFKFLGLG